MKFMLSLLFLTLFLLVVILSCTIFYPTVDIRNLNFDSKFSIDINFPERQNIQIKPGTEKSIRWKDSILKNKQEYAFIFLHGFTGYRGELSPLIESVQDDYQANLFYQRISGHGYINNEITNVGINDWVQDINESRSYADVLGEKKIFFANSTGAGMSLLLTKQFHDEKSCLIFFSPNFGLKNKLSLLGTGIMGNIFIRALIGETFKMPLDNNPLKSSIIKFNSIKPFLELTKIFRNIDIRELKNPLLIFYSKTDSVIDTKEIENKINSISNHLKVQLYDIGNGHLLIDWNNEYKRNEVKRIINAFISSNCSQ